MDGNFNSTINSNQCFLDYLRLGENVFIVVVVYRKKKHRERIRFLCLELNEARERQDEPSPYAMSYIDLGSAASIGCRTPKKKKRWILLLLPGNWVEVEATLSLITEFGRDLLMNLNKHTRYKSACIF